MLACKLDAACVISLEPGRKVVLLHILSQSEEIQMAPWNELYGWLELRCLGVLLVDLFVDICLEVPLQLIYARPCN